MENGPWGTAFSQDEGRGDLGGRTDDDTAMFCDTARGRGVQTEGAKQAGSALSGHGPCAQLVPRGIGWDPLLENTPDSTFLVLKVLQELNRVALPVRMPWLCLLTPSRLVHF